MDSVSDCALRESVSNVDALLEVDVVEGGEKVKDEIVRVAASMGENVVLRRASIVSGDVVGSYVHAPVEKGSSCGLSAAAVGLKIDSETDLSKVQQDLEVVAKQICMHVVAASPKFLDVNSVDEESKSREESILTEEVRNSGKDEKMIPRIVAGRMNKYYKENCLMEQQFILSEDKKDTVRKILGDHAKELGLDSIDITSYTSLKCGE